MYIESASIRCKSNKDAEKQLLCFILCSFYASVCQLFDMHVLLLILVTSIPIFSCKKTDT